MKIKPDWIPILHETRQKEIELVFGPLKQPSFRRGLEIGAGDGFQSDLIKPYVEELICTEYDQAKLRQEKKPGIVYKICDAEQLPKYFKAGRFDLIFSSNVMEHITAKEKVLADMAKLLSDDGLAINIMPGPFLKMSWLLLFYPNQAITLLEVLTERRGGRRLSKLAGGDKEEIGRLRQDLGNNPKLSKRAWLLAQFWPEPHGAYRGHLAELRGYRISHWKRLHRENGLEVIRVIKMPVNSGYGFGLPRVRRLLERLGFAYGYAYVSRRAGTSTAYPPAS